MIKLQPKNPIFIDFLLYLVISPNNSGVSWHINLLKGKIWQGIDFTEYSSGDNVFFFFRWYLFLPFLFPSLVISCILSYLPSVYCHVPTMQKYTNSSSPSLRHDFPLCFPIWPIRSPQQWSIYPHMLFLRDGVSVHLCADCTWLHMLLLSHENRLCVCVCVRVCILNPLLAASALCPLDNCAEKQCQKASNHNCHQKKRAFVRNQVKIMQLATWNCSDTDMLPTFTFLMSFKCRWIRFSVKKKKSQGWKWAPVFRTKVFFLYLPLFSYWMFSEAFVILPNCEYI